jgi:hypothetical protein
MVGSSRSLWGCGGRKPNSTGRNKMQRIEQDALHKLAVDEINTKWPKLMLSMSVPYVALALMIYGAVKALAG